MARKFKLNILDLMVIIAIFPVVLNKLSIHIYDQILINIDSSYYYRLIIYALACGYCNFRLLRNKESALIILGVTLGIALGFLGILIGWIISMGTPKKTV